MKIQVTLPVFNNDAVNEDPIYVSTKYYTARVLQELKLEFRDIAAIINTGESDIPVDSKRYVLRTIDTNDTESISHLAKKLVLLKKMYKQTLKMLKNVPTGEMLTLLRDRLDTIYLEIEFAIHTVLLSQGKV